MKPVFQKCSELFVRHREYSCRENVAGMDGRSIPQLCLIIVPYVSWRPNPGEYRPQHSVGLGSQISRLHRPHTKHGQSTPGFSITKKTRHRIPIFRGIHADLLLEGEGTVKRGNIEYQCGNLSQCRTHTRSYVRNINWYEKCILQRSI
jgi:hypothetical protein